MSEMTPREIVSELDKHHRSQDSMAFRGGALRNRWRRIQLTKSAAP